MAEAVTRDEMPVVSVVIPAFDAAGSLAATVASAQRQSLSDIEILIVDDASTDGTLALARRLAAADPRLRVIAADENRGPAGARNLGFAAARGEWIALLDADDAFEPQRLERLVARARDSGVDMMADNLLLEAEDGSVAPMLGTADLEDCVTVSGAGFVRGNLPDPAQPRKSYGFLKPILRRAFLQRHGLRYDETLRFAEDFILYLDCFSAGARFCLQREAFYRYRLRGNSLTARHSIEDLQRLREILRQRGAGAAPDLHAALRRYRQSIEQRLQWRLVIEAVKRRDGAAALGAALEGRHVFTYVCGQLVAEAWRRLGPGRARAKAKAAET